MHEHVGGLNADADHPAQQADHGMALFCWLAFQSLDACRFDLLDLLLGEAQAVHVAPQLGQCVRWQCCAFRRLQCLQLPRRSSQVRAEASNPEPGKIGLYSVHEARGLLHKVLALSARSPCVLVCNCGDRSHAAVLWFTAQPAEKSALEELGIETIGLRPSMFARYRNARRVDHIGLDLTGAQPARQPEAVAASLIGHSDPLDDLAGLIGFLLPTMQKLQQSMLIAKAGVRFPARYRRPANLTGPSRSQRSMLRLVQEPRGIGSNHSAAAAWGHSIVRLVRRWCDYLAARPIASKADKQGSLNHLAMSAHCPVSGMTGRSMMRVAPPA